MFDSITALKDVIPGWIPLAVLFSFSSLLAAARTHRRLLISVGEKLTIRRMAAITLAGNAISVSIPVAGTELSAAFTYEQFRMRGLAPGKAVWTITAGGIAAAVTFAFIAVVGALVSGNEAATITGAASGLIGAGILVTVLLSLRNDTFRSKMINLVTGALRTCKRLFKRPKNDPADLVQHTFDQFVELRLAPTQWGRVFAHALWNWVADLICFAISIHAVGADIPWAGLILCYSAGAGANSLGLVPGGIGIVEVTLAAALTQAGVAGNLALSAVLVYRVISFWLIVLLGWISYLTLKRGGDNREHEHFIQLP